jgi:hypothetical protein
MTAGMDTALRAVFEAATEFIEPPAGLASRIRMKARKRRRRTLVAALAACAVLVSATGVAYVAAGGRQAPTAGTGNPDRPTWNSFSIDYQVSQLAVSGRYLYVMSGQADSSQIGTLALYDRTSGRLVRTASQPATAVAFALGPGGLIWLEYMGSGAHARTGIWLLSPDLLRHSALAGGLGKVIVPASQTTAWIPGQRGLYRVSLPAPGRTGRSTEVLQPGTGVGVPQNTAPGSWAGLFDSHVVVQVTDGGGLNSHLVIAGQPAVTFGGSPQTQILSAASTGSSLWVSTFAIRNGDASLQGPLVRLNAHLQPTTPAWVTANPALARSEGVWSDGSTVWVATGVKGHPLVCFTAGSQSGPVTAVPLDLDHGDVAAQRERGAGGGEVTAVAATTDRVYVTAERVPGSPPDTVTSYPVPAACR